MMTSWRPRRMDSCAHAVPTRLVHAGQQHPRGSVIPGSQVPKRSPPATEALSDSEARAREGRVPELAKLLESVGPDTSPSRGNRLAIPIAALADVSRGIAVFRKLYIPALRPLIREA
jgi:hypothetical protein